MMHKNILKDISAGSFAVLSALVGLSWGVIFGAFIFIGGFLSDGINSLMPKSIIEGVPSGIVLLFLIPAFFGAMGLVVGWISCPVFKLVLQGIGGVNLETELGTEDLAPPVRQPDPVPVRRR